MFNVFVSILIIFGTIVGAGFASGNEIVVFFTRFGQSSYVYIILSGFLLFVCLYLLLRFGYKLAKIIETNKFLNFLTIFVSLVFAASMFAGIENLFSHFSVWLHVVFSVILILLCIIVTIKGIGGIEKMSIFLMPILMIAFFVVLTFCMVEKSDLKFDFSGGAFGVWYAVLYVALNTSLNVIIFAKMGQKLTKKQTGFVSLFSSILLVSFLLIANYVLLSNQESFVSEMPILYISQNNLFIFILEFIVILIGCFSTLISLCFTLNNSTKKLINNNLISIFISVFLPYFIASVGFSKIISFLYPICSVVGIFIILFSIMFFNQGNKIIHSKSKDTKDCG